MVVADLVMPFMNGTAMIRALQRINPQVKVIMASGIMSNSLAAESQRLGVAAFLGKPYNAVMLLKLVQEVLQKSVSLVGGNP